MSKSNPYHHRQNSDPALRGQEELLQKYLMKLPPLEYGKAMLQLGILTEGPNPYRPHNHLSREREKMIQFSTLTN